MKFISYFVQYFLKLLLQKGTIIRNLAPTWLRQAETLGKIEAQDYQYLNLPPVLVNSPGYYTLIKKTLVKQKMLKNLAKKFKDEENSINSLLLQQFA